MRVGFRKIDSDEDWDWMTNQVPLLLVSDMTSILAVDLDTKEIQAGCVMDTWTPTSCQIHFAIKNPMVLRHGFFQEISKFVFDTAGRKTLYGLVPANNEKALRIDAKIGFTEVTRLHDAYDVGVDYVLLELQKENCNFNAED